MVIHFYKIPKRILIHQQLAVFFLAVCKFLVVYLFHLLFLYFLFYTEVILLAILFPIRSPVASAVFWTTLLEAVFVASIPVFVAVSINFLTYLSPNFLANYKKLNPSTYFLYFGSAHFDNNYPIIITTQYHSNIIFYFKLSAILISKPYFNGWKFCICCI